MRRERIPVMMYPLAVFAVVTAAVAWTPETAVARQDFRWSGRIPAGQAIEVKGINGEIRALAAEGDEVLVLAEKHSRRGDVESVTFDVVEHEGGITICAVYPGRGGRENRCAPGDGGRMETRDNDVVVDFTVRVPRDVRFIGRTVNGGIEAESLTADVVARTVNGEIDVETAGHAQASTVNGEITARLGRADWTGTLEFETVNGGITVELPADAAAVVRARTTNGGIETDFPLVVRGLFTSHRIEGTIGAGGRVLELKTVNGGITLRKG